MLEDTLASLHRFLASCPPGLQGVRLLRYGGGDLLSVTDLHVDGLGAELAAAVGEGASVDWVRRNALLYVRVAEAGRAPPSWERLFAEQDMAAARSALDEAGPEDQVQPKR